VAEKVDRDADAKSRSGGATLLAHRLPRRPANISSSLLPLGLPFVDGQALAAHRRVQHDQEQTKAPGVDRVEAGRQATSGQANQTLIKPRVMADRRQSRGLES
jgi:hypothetical protein